MFYDSVIEAFPLNKSCKGTGKATLCFLEFQSWYKLVGKVLKSTLISISIPTKQVKFQLTIVSSDVKRKLRVMVPDERALDALHEGVAWYVP